MAAAEAAVLAPFVATAASFNLEALKAPFPPNEIEWRVGSTNADKTKGLALAYLTARHIMERLDAVCGPSNWQDRYEFHNARTVCYLSVRIDGEWITKADGAGDSDVEAEKGAISDALKRAAVKWGIGRYLYDLESPWVQIEARGRSFVIKPSEYDRLEKLLGGAQGQVVASTPFVHRLSASRAQEVVNWPNIEAKIRAAASLKVLDNWHTLSQQIEPWMPVQWNDLLQGLIDDRRKALATKTNDALAAYESSATDEVSHAPV